VEVLEQPNRLQPRPVRSVLVPPNRLLAHLVLPSKNRPVRLVLVHLNPPLQPRSVLANNKQPLQAAFLVLPNKNRPVLGSAPLHLQLRLLVLHLLALGKLISYQYFYWYLVGVEIDTIMAKLYIPPKSLFQ
jgi:hypothetical protein